MAQSHAQSGKTVISFDEELAIPTLTEVSLIIFTNTTGEILILKQILATGQAAGLYRFLKNSSNVFKHNTSESNPTLDVKFSGILMAQGDVIELKVTNCDDANTADFRGTFILDRAY